MLFSPAAIFGQKLEKVRPWIILTDKLPDACFGDTFLGGVFVLDTDLIVIQAGETLQRRLQATGLRDDRPIEGRLCYELLHHQEQPCPSCPALQAVESGDSHAGWISTAGPDGESCCFEVHACPIADQQGKIDRVVVTITDLTEVFQTEANLKDVEAFYHAVVEDQPALIYRYKADGTIVFANNRVARYTNKNLEDVIGTNIYDMVNTENIDKARQQLACLTPENPVATHEHAGTDASGETRWYQWTDRLIFDQDGNAIEFQGVGYDITERKQMEEAERQQRMLAEALRDTAEALNSTLEMDEVLIQILASLVRVVPHEANSLVFLDQENMISQILIGEEHEKDITELRRLEGKSVGYAPLYNQMLKSGEPVLISDVTRSDDWVVLQGLSWVRSYLGIPVRMQNRDFGFINLYHSRPEFFTYSHAENLRAFANQAAVAIRNAELFEEALWLAVHDPLTGVYNRRHFFDVARGEFSRSKRYRRMLAVIMLDLDHFKQINDTHGHAVGDVVLQNTVSLIKEHLRDVDIIGRYGGEEFIILLPEASAEIARMIGERLCNSLNAAPVDTESGSIFVAASMGAAGIESSPGFTLKHLVDRADQALYAAKQAGRNRVVQWASELSGDSPG